MPYVDTNYLAKGMADSKKCQELRIGQTRQAAEQILNRAEKTGFVSSKKTKHPDFSSQIRIWWLQD